MMKLAKYGCIVLGVLIFGCEDIYSPEVEERESVIVAEAQIVAGEQDNVIRLKRSLSFNNESYNFPAVEGAAVTIIDDLDREYILPEINPGEFSVYFTVQRDRHYKIIITADGETFESGFEPVPEVPVMDSIYGEIVTRVIKIDGENDVDDFRARRGVQLYFDMLGGDQQPYYRFSAKKILLYYYIVQIIVMGSPEDEIHFVWKTRKPWEPFNIAASPEYSNSGRIEKHPLFFMENNPVNMGEYFSGWILILNQHGLSKSGYSYYRDLNNQLNSDGKLFDPLYVQARSNLKCTTDPEKIILGNFEISSVVERRFLVKYLSEDKGFVLKPIPYFYDIPDYGEQINERPEFWEFPNKIYPNE